MADDERSIESPASDEESSDESSDSGGERSIKSLVAEYRAARTHHDQGEVVQEAIDHSDALNVFKTLQKEAGLGVSDLYGYYMTLLEQAVSNANHELVAWLLAEGADPNVHLMWGPLHDAAAEPRVNTWVVSALLDAGAKFERGRPLHRAAAAGTLEKVKILIERGADVKAVDLPGGYPPDLAKGTPLHEAAGAHLVETKENDYERWNPDEQVQIVKLLLEKGADTQSKDNYGRLPVDWVLTGAGFHKPVFKKPTDWVMSNTGDDGPEWKKYSGELDEEKHRQRIRALLE